MCVYLCEVRVASVFNVVVSCRSCPDTLSCAWLTVYPVGQPQEMRRLRVRFDAPRRRWFAALALPVNDSLRPGYAAAAGQVLARCGPTLTLVPAPCVRALVAAMRRGNRLPSDLIGVVLTWLPRQRTVLLCE